MKSSEKQGTKVTYNGTEATEKEGVAGSTLRDPEGVCEVNGEECAEFLDFGKRIDIKYYCFLKNKLSVLNDSCFRFPEQLQRSYIGSPTCPRPVYLIANICHN